MSLAGVTDVDGRSRGLLLRGLPTIAGKTTGHSSWKLPVTAAAAAVQQVHHPLMARFSGTEPLPAAAMLVVA